MILVSEHREPLLWATHTDGTWTVTPTEGRDVPQVKGSGSTIPAAVVDYLTRADDADTASAYPACAGAAVRTLRAAAHKLGEVRVVGGARAVLHHAAAEMRRRACLLARFDRARYKCNGG